MAGHNPGGIVPDGSEHSPGLLALLPPHECLLKMVDGTVQCLRTDEVHRRAGHDKGPGGALIGKTARQIGSGMR